MISNIRKIPSFWGAARRGLVVASVGTLITLSGCATPGELTLIRDDLFRIEEKLNAVQRDIEKGDLERAKAEDKAPKPLELAKEISKELSKEYGKDAEVARKNQAEIRASMNELNDKLEVLRAELERNGYKLSEVARRMDSLVVRLAIGTPGTESAPIVGPSAPQPSPGVVALDPSQLYQTAYGDYQKGNYSWAILGFKEYLGKYPQTELADDAQYLLGECYYSLKDHLNAFGEFDKVPQLYPQSNLAASAYLKSAYALLELKRAPEATDRLNAVIQNYPNSDEAKKAQEQLKTIPQPVS